ncbi:MAG TPA: MBL fold metallo-hydrolase [Mycobacteriales bacterium]|nr:MBL fold metallo-hydrolase [Mycobacteriales bacterium]
MKLTIVGCAGTFPGPDTACSSYLLEHEGFRLLIDAGNGSTGALQKSIGLLDLDAIMLSHMHGDHYLDLVTYTYARRYHPSGPTPSLPVHGPSDVEEHIAAAFGRPVHDLLEAVYDFHPASGPGNVEIGPFTIERDRVNHPVETYGMRITAGGRSLAYSADSAPCDELIKLAREADLFLCEASYLEGEDNPPDIHLTGKEAAEHAARADAKRLMLTHLVPWGDRDRTFDEATSAYDGEITVAAPGIAIDV